ncbi:hypothetical protein N0V88_001566 [Collariella sp. IMI 366227]|nr:hypothetical protein N0V88_001566 [Collariella sp. IMI 366227]
MCLTKTFYNTYSDGVQNITEKKYPCREGRGCSQPDVIHFNRNFPFTKLGDVRPESYRSLSERNPTPYRSSHTSPSPSRRRESRESTLYTSGSSHGKRREHDYSSYEPYKYHRFSRHFSRDRPSREREREPRFKRHSAAPQIVYADRHSRSSSRDIPIGPVQLAEEYGRRYHSRSRSREHGGASSSHDSSAHHHHSSHRRRTDNPQTTYLLVSDQDELRRRQRHEDRRQSFGPSTSSAARDLTTPYDTHHHDSKYTLPPPLHSHHPQQPHYWP